MDSQYSEENSMESHTEDDNSITTEERDENSSEEEQSSITTEDSSKEEIDPWSTLINDAASKVRDQYDDILQALLMEGHDESEAKQEAFEKILPVFQKELGDAYMDNLAWMKALKKDPIHKKIMATRDEYVNNNMLFANGHDKTIIELAIAKYRDLPATEKYLCFRHVLANNNLISLVQDMYIVVHSCWYDKTPCMQCKRKNRY